MSSVPFWLLALALACVAPYLAAAVQAVLEARLRRRTLDVLARAASYGASRMTSDVATARDVRRDVRGALERGSVGGGTTEVPGGGERREPSEE